MDVEVPGGCGIFASFSALEGDIDYSHGLKVESIEIQRYGAETIVKFCSQKVLISRLLL